LFFRATVRAAGPARRDAGTADRGRTFGRVLAAPQPGGAGRLVEAAQAAFELRPQRRVEGLELARGHRYDAIVCVSAVIRGETPHFDYVAAEAAKGLAHAAMETGVPIAFGVLTTNTLEQAIDRAGAKSGNKGFDAAMSAVEMANLMRTLRQSV